MNRIECSHLYPTVNLLLSQILWFTDHHTSIFDGCSSDRLTYSICLTTRLVWNFAHSIRFNVPNLLRCRNGIFYSIITSVMMVVELLEKIATPGVFVQMKEVERVVNISFYSMSTRVLDTICWFGALRYSVKNYCKIVVCRKLISTSWLVVGKPEWNRLFNITRKIIWLCGKWSHFPSLTSYKLAKLHYLHGKLRKYEFKRPFASHSEWGTVQYCTSEYED